MHYSYEYKMQCIEMYRNGEWPETPEHVKSQHDFRAMIRRWVRMDENNNGCLNHAKGNKKWAPEEKLELVSRVLAGESNQSVALDAGILPGMLYKWVRNYKMLGYNGLINKQKGRPSHYTNMENSNNESPRKLTDSEYEELVRLKSEVAFYKAENEVIKKEIALREEKEAALLKAKKQQSLKNSEKRDTN